MRRIGTAILGCLALLGVGCDPDGTSRPEPRSLASHAGSCDGVLDYADELTPSQVSLVRQTDLGDGIVEVEISVTLQNLAEGSFRSGSAILDATAASPDLGILGDPPPLAADFGAIAPFGSARGSATLQLRLPQANVAELVARLADGSQPLTVFADEAPVLGDGIRVASPLGDDASRGRRSPRAVDRTSVIRLREPRLDGLSAPLRRRIRSARSAATSLGWRFRGGLSLAKDPPAGVPCAGRCERACGARSHRGRGKPRRSRGSLA